MTAHITYTDQELLKQLSQDSRDAFDLLYSRYWEDMYRSAFAVLKDAAACKDVVQDIFIWLWEHRYKLEVINLKPYLKAAVKFKVANYIRSGNIRSSFFKELANTHVSAAITSTEELLEVKQLKAIVQLAIAELPEKCREIFQLSREEQLSNREIASRLDISVKTVENQMTIAIRRIRKAADPYIATTGTLLYLVAHQYFQ